MIVLSMIDGTALIGLRRTGVFGSSQGPVDRLGLN